MYKGEWLLMFYASLKDMYIFDNTLFDDAKIPENIIKETLIEIILDECGDNEVLYDNPEILKIMINAFFETGYYKYKGLADTTEFEYDPLVNYDLVITENREKNNNINRENKSNSNGDSENKITAFNSNMYNPNEHNINKSTVSGEEKENNNENEKVIRRESGDNSARSTQYMIKEQREILDFNIYKIIASDFEDEITIPVYSARGCFNMGGF